MSDVTQRTIRDFRGIWRFAGLCVSVAIIGGFGRIVGVAQTDSETTQPTEKVPPGKLVASAMDSKYVGVASCSAAACHGGPLTADPSRLWNCSYTIWASQQEPRGHTEKGSPKTANRAPLIDKHNRAYAILYDERSKRIVTLLDNLTDIKSAHPEKEARCIACHSVPRDPATVPNSILSDGVSCELCHGPAASWIADHTKTPYVESYETGGYTQLIKLGMYDTQNLVSRARICASCHVGSPGDKDQLVRDMNHDLIAAGHPRLDFGFPAFLDVLPKHWNDNVATPGSASVKSAFKTDRETHAEAWAIGQVVAAEAALKLLADRAAHDVNDARPWPEFSEYDCYACHHGLESGQSPRQKAAEDRKTRLGSLRWGTWYFPEVEFLLASEPFGKWYEDFGAPLAELKAQMAKPSSVLNRKAIQESATKAAAAMGRMAGEIERSSFDQATVERLLLRAGDEKFAPGDWDEAAQRLLTLQSLWNARQFFQSPNGDSRSKDEQEISEALDAIRDNLQFRKIVSGHDQPANLLESDPRFDSPDQFDPDLIRNKFFQPAFERIRALLQEKK